MSATLTSGCDDLMPKDHGDTLCAEASDARSI